MTSPVGGGAGAGTLSVMHAPSFGGSFTQRSHGRGSVRARGVRPTAHHRAHGDCLGGRPTQACRDRRVGVFQVVTSVALLGTALTFHAQRRLHGSPQCGSAERRRPTERPASPFRRASPTRVRRRAARSRTANSHAGGYQSPERPAFRTHRQRTRRPTDARGGNLHDATSSCRAMQMSSHATPRRCSSSPISHSVSFFTM